MGFDTVGVQIRDSDRAVGGQSLRVPRPSQMDDSDGDTDVVRGHHPQVFRAPDHRGEKIRTRIRTRIRIVQYIRIGIRIRIRVRIHFR